MFLCNRTDKIFAKYHLARKKKNGKVIIINLSVLNFEPEQHHLYGVQNKHQIYTHVRCSHGNKALNSGISKSNAIHDNFTQFADTHNMQFPKVLIIHTYPF